MTVARPRRARSRSVLAAVCLAGALTSGCGAAPGTGAASGTGTGSGTGAMAGAVTGRTSGADSTTAAAPTGAPSAGRGAGWVVTGLGDSVTAGSACDCDDFVQQYARLTSRATGRPVTAANLGVPGQTSAGLADLVRRPEVARQLAGSDIVLVTTGANDLGGALGDWQDGSCTQACFDAAMPSIAANVADVVGEIRRLRAGRATEVLVTDYWNVFVDGQVGAALGPRYRTLSDRVTRQANSAICAGAQRGGGTCVDLYAPFKGDGSQDPTALLADDGDHPDADGHRAIAEALAAYGWHELAEPS